MTRKENKLIGHNIAFDESYISAEDETVTYYFTADKSLIESLYPGKYPEAAASEVSMELPISCYEANMASIMVSPTLDCDGSATDYDWNSIDIPYEEVEELLALAKEPVVIVQLDYKGSYNRYALTLEEFKNEFEELLEEDMPYPSDRGEAYTLRPMVHVWYRLSEVESRYFEIFFTDMSYGLPASDAEDENLAYIDFDAMTSLKKSVANTVFKMLDIHVLSFESCADAEYGNSLIQYRIGTDFVSFMFSDVMPPDRFELNQEFKEFIISNLPDRGSFPSWMQLSNNLLEEIIESSFDMRFIEHDIDNWNQEQADMILDDAFKNGLSDVVTEGEDCYLTIYAGAMCGINWAGHPQYGKPCLVARKNQKDVIKGVTPERAASLLDMLICKMVTDAGMQVKSVMEELHKAGFEDDDLVQLGFEPKQETFH